MAPISDFARCLTEETKLIDATLSCIPHFKEAIEKYDNLTNVVVPHSVGLGAVRIVPSFLDTSSLSGDLKSEIDTLNATLATRLHQEDINLFKQDVTVDGHVCVSLGVETKPMTPETAREYAEKIYNIALSLKIESKIEENLTQIIKKRIRQAEEEIKNETEELTYQQTGLVRMIPLVGSLWNWWSPIDEPNAHGRSFNLCTSDLKPITSPSSSSSSSSSSTLSYSRDLETKLEVQSPPLPLLPLKKEQEQKEDHQQEQELPQIQHQSEQQDKDHHKSSNQDN